MRNVVYLIAGNHICVAHASRHYPDQHLVPARGFQSQCFDLERSALVTNQGGLDLPFVSLSQATHFESTFCAASRVNPPGLPQHPKLVAAGRRHLGHAPHTVSVLYRTQLAKNRGHLSRRTRGRSASPCCASKLPLNCMYSRDQKNRGALVNWNSGPAVPTRIALPWLRRS